MNNLKEIMERLEAIRNVSIIPDEPLAEHSSIRIGGLARFAAFPKSEEAIVSIIRTAKEMWIPYTVVGNCTNILFRDSGFDGLVVFSSGIKTVAWNGNLVTAGCGLSLGALAHSACARGMAGLEFAAGIPGTVGGAVYMNAGTTGHSISDVLVSSRYLDQGIKERNCQEHAFGNRSSIYQHSDELILSATFQLHAEDVREIRKRQNGYLENRRAKQPLEYPNLGSIFKRPPGELSAGELIDRAGLKGTRIGGAMVSKKHAGFIVNTGGATAEDVLQLMEMVRQTVQKSTGVCLEPEIICVP